MGSYGFTNGPYERLPESALRRSWCRPSGFLRDMVPPRHCDLPNHRQRGVRSDDAIAGIETEVEIAAGVMTHDVEWLAVVIMTRLHRCDELRHQMPSECSVLEHVPARTDGHVVAVEIGAIENGLPVVTEVVDADETAALIDFVAVCRTYASELAINEVTQRTYSELQQYVEKSTDALVQSLRGSDPKAKPFRHMQAQAAVRFCELLFGHDYASLMHRAVESAMVVVERKPARAG